MADSPPPALPRQAPARTRRIDLDGAGRAAAVTRSELTPPPGMHPRADIDADDAPDGNDDVLWAASGLALLSRARVTVQVDIGARYGTGRGLRTVLGVAAAPTSRQDVGLGVALMALPDDGMQVSVFPDVALGTEPARAVPAAVDLASPQDAAWRCLDTRPATPPAPLSGVLPLVALTDYPQLKALSDPSPAAAGRRLHLTDEQTDLAERLDAATLGVLRALASGLIQLPAQTRSLSLSLSRSRQVKIQTRGRPDVGIAQVVWFATEQGWIAAEPAPELPGPRMVRLRAVAPADLGTALAPGIAQLLDSPSSHLPDHPDHPDHPRRPGGGLGEGDGPGEGRR